MTDWNQRYLRGEHILDDPHSLITSVAGVLSPGRALDLACGAGRHAIWLAERGWRVTAVDSSPAAIEIVHRRAQEKNIAIQAVVANLEQYEFAIEPEAWDLIVVCNYLQRDLFPGIRSGIRIGGTVVCVIAMADEDPHIKPMNPAYLLNPGELRQEFHDWEILHDFEGKPAGGTPRRAVAEIAARRL
jgi:SAM-dependent methyltransferase